MATKNTERGKAVVVTTAHRGVFFGYLVADKGDAVKLQGARNCLYWSKDVGGFLGLAATGPSKSCRIGARADLELRAVTSVSDCTPEAVKAWDEAPCVS